MYEYNVVFIQDHLNGMWLWALYHCIVGDFHIVFLSLIRAAEQDQYVAFCGCVTCVYEKKN